MSTDSLVDQLRALARDLGFASMGVARACALDREHDALVAWLASGRHGPLGYMSRRQGVLRDPACQSFCEGARSIVMVSLPVTRLAPRPGSAASIVARHARGLDYHEVVASRLRNLMAGLRRLDPGLRGRVFVDTAPVMEKAWAQRAGLGFIGRNGLLVQPGLGSFTVLGGLAVTTDLVPGEPSPDGCGDCRACVDACPVGAIAGDRRVDARLCLSCLTVERREPLALSEASLLAGRAAFGCDLCQLACPYNADPPMGPVDFDPLPALGSLDAADLLSMDDASLASLIAPTAMHAAGPERLRESFAASLGSVTTS